MGATKVRFDIGSGIIELEGEQAFVEKELAEFRAMVTDGLIPWGPKGRPAMATDGGSPESDIEQVDEETAEGKQDGKKAKGQRKSRTSGRQTPRVIGNLSMAGLKAFMEEKSPKSHQEKYAAVAVWLKEKHTIDEVGIDHVNTCYMEMAWPRPEVMKQVFINAKNKRGFFEPCQDANLFRLTTIGEDFVLHKLPPAAKK